MSTTVPELDALSSAQRAFGVAAPAPQRVPAAGDAGAAEPEEGGRSAGRARQADLLLQYGVRKFRFVRHHQVVYAVPVAGGPIARPLRSKGGGGGTGSLRQCLIRDYVQATGRAPSQAALADAVAALEGNAMDSDVQPVHLRIAADPEEPHVTWLDLGRPDALSVCLEPGMWSVTVPSTVAGPLWRRTRLVGELPVPQRCPGGWEQGMRLLAGLLPVRDGALHLAVAWLLAALRPDIPRPCAYLSGEQGTGKSTVGRLLIRLVDGADAHLRSVPKTEDDLAVAASAGWCLGLDNLKSIPAWLSGSLCRAITGEAIAKRELYSDDDVLMLAFQRPVLLTGIDVGALDGDLAERMLPLVLTTINSAARRTERQLWAAFAQDHAVILGALLDLACLVWARMPEAAEQMTHRPRMADWGELLWALDDVTGWKTLDAYLGTQEDLVDDVIDADPVATAIQRWSRSGSTAWKATTAELAEQLKPPVVPEDWPKTLALFSARLVAVAPALRARGIDVRSLPRTRAGRSFQITVAHHRSP